MKPTIYRITHLWPNKAEDRIGLTVQIKPETDELNALPSRFVSLQDYEALEREARS